MSDAPPPSNPNQSIVRIDVHALVVRTTKVASRGLKDIERFDNQDRALELASPGDIFDAVRKGDARKVRAIIATRPAAVNSRNFEGDTPLTLACFLGQAGVAKLIIQAGADVRATSKRGFTPLLSLVWTNMFMTRALTNPSPTVRRAQLDLLKLLIDKGADVNAPGDKGATPLHGAVWNAPASIVKALLDHGAAVDQHDDNGWTPLRIAAQYDAVEKAKLLLDRGADVNARTVQGETPLHIAAEMGNVRTVKLLLQRGADRAAADNSGSTPLQRAIQKSKMDTAQLLQ